MKEYESGKLNSCELACKYRICNGVIFNWIKQEDALINIFSRSQDEVSEEILIKGFRLTGINGLENRIIKDYLKKSYLIAFK